MTTKRQLRLARAIEDLSARDMQALLAHLTPETTSYNYRERRQHHAERLLAFAEAALAEESEPAQ